MGVCLGKSNLLSNSDNNVPLFDLKGNTYNAKVVDVYDGDTCSIVIILNNKLTKFKLRTVGYDTPEIKPPKNDANRDHIIDMAIKSRNYFISRVTNCTIILDKHYSKNEIKELLKSNKKIITVTSEGWDKYGRLLGNIFVNNININNEMIEKGYGNKYDGGTKSLFV
tara:strand:- start:100 stop:600 length:501 start_codon:yes stop_codon:yes gene_type:complete